MIRTVEDAFLTEDNCGVFAIETTDGLRIEAGEPSRVGTDYVSVKVIGAKGGAPVFEQLTGSILVFAKGANLGPRVRIACRANFPDGSVRALNMPGVRFLLPKC